MSRTETADKTAPSPVFGLARGAVHEFYAACHADAACLTGSVMMMARVVAPGTTLWIRHQPWDHEAGAPYAAGFAELGLDPASCILVRVRDAQSALQAGLEGARCTALGAVIVEIWGETRAYDLTASRRLALAARDSGVPVFVSRSAAHPTLSAATTRWLVRAGSSQALAANAPGQPAFHLTLLRARNGQEDVHHRLEWDRDARRLENRFSGPAPAQRAPLPDKGRQTPLSGPVVPFSFDRPGPTREGTPPQRQAG